MVALLLLTYKPQRPLRTFKKLLLYNEETCEAEQPRSIPFIYSLSFITLAFWPTFIMLPFSDALIAHRATFSRCFCLRLALPVQYGQDKFILFVIAAYSAATWGTHVTFSAWACY